MENIGLNSDIQAGGKVFHIQTQFMEPSEKIVSTIFEDGKVITRKSIAMKNSVPVPELKVAVSRLHRDMSEDIEMLFYISDKVGTIRHAVSNNKLGLVFYKMNLYDEAIEEFQKALEINPEYVEVYKNLGCAYLRKNMLQQAKAAFVAGIDKNENYADLHNNLGYTYFLLNNFSDAIKEISGALDINPDYIDAQFYLSIVYLKSIVYDVQQSSLPSKIERLNHSKELLDNIREKGANYKVEYIVSALSLMEENKYSEALNALESAQSDHPPTVETDIENDFYLKFMFGGKGKEDRYINEYVEQLKQVINKAPLYPDLHNNLGIAYLIQCRNMFLNALEEFRHALEINPNYKKAEKNLKLAENDGKGFLILLRAILK